MSGELKMNIIKLKNSMRCIFSSMKLSYIPTILVKKNLRKNFNFFKQFYLYVFYYYPTTITKVILPYNQKIFYSECSSIRL